MTSSVHPVDLAIFGVFLLATLVVGLSYGRQVKTIRDYALGGRNFATSTLVATIVATWASGSALFIGLENTYSDGLYYIIANLCLPIGLLITGQLTVHMGEFLNNVSVVEAMGDMYGKTVRIIAAVCSILARAGYIAIQFKVMSTMLSIIFNLESSMATYISACIVILYSSFGGIKAVTFTDVLQFFTFGTVIPILALVVWRSISDSTQVIDTIVNNPNFDIKEVVRLSPRFLATLGLMVYFITPIGGGSSRNISAYCYGKRCQASQTCFYLCKLVFSS